MEKNITMTREEIKNMILSTVEYALIRVLERHGCVSPLISRQEMIRQIGRLRVDEAIRSGHLTRIKDQEKGKNSKIFCLRADFDKYVLNLKNIY